MIIIMKNEINIILLALSVIIGFIGFFFVLKIFLVWRQVDMNVLKARVFLSKGFLVRNWIYIFLVGAIIVMQRLLALLDSLEISLPSSINILFDLLGVGVVVLLVLLAYYWYKLVYSAIGHTQKDLLKEVCKPYR